MNPTYAKGALWEDALACYGRIDSLGWDPERFQRKGGAPFMHYTSRMGRLLLREHHIA